MVLNAPITASMEDAEKLFKRIPNKADDPFAEMKKRTRTDFDSLDFKKGDIITIPAKDVKLWAFNKTYGASQAVVACSRGGVISNKILTLSALDRSLALYDEETIAPSGGTLEAKTAAVHTVFDQAKACATDAEVADLIAGKTLVVADEVQGRVARYRNGEIIGTRLRTIPVWDWVTITPAP